MAETIKGAGVFWGIGTSFVAAGTGIGTTGGTNNPQSVKFSVEAEKRIKVDNSQGETIAEAFANQMQKMTIDVIPTGTTIAIAKAQSILPEPGAVVTITDTDDPEAAALNSGKYIFISGTKNRSNGDVVKMTFELEQYVARDLSTTIT